MIGFSRGGIQGLLSFQDDPVDSYIIWGGVSDVHLMYEERGFKGNAKTYGRSSEKIKGI